MTLLVRMAGEADRDAVHALRHEVFVVGQGVPVELERDEHDDVCDAVVAVRDGCVVGTGRLLEAVDGVAAIGRMAVAEGVRRRGIGRALLARLEERARERGVREVELHAQLHARSFYERAGYRAVGEVYDEAGIDHVTMRKQLRS